AAAQHLEVGRTETAHRLTGSVDDSDVDVHEGRSLRPPGVNGDNRTGKGQQGQHEEANSHSEGRHEYRRRRRRPSPERSGPAPVAVPVASRPPLFGLVAEAEVD